MKKTITFMLGMFICICGFAQTEEESTSLPEQGLTEEVGAPQVQSSLQASDLQQLSDILNRLGGQMLQTEVDPDAPIQYPLRGKSRFARKHYIYQTVEISTIAGKDKDISQGSDIDDSANNPTDMISKLNFGMNIGYSMIFVPGQIKDDRLEINRFGFAYSLGTVASFDRQEDYGVTCDFLAKFGVETGNGHSLGIGFDAMIGTGKSPGVFYELNPKDPDDNDPNYYTSWCFKYGSQIWLKTNLVTTKIKNTDMLVFARLVYSQNPYDDDALLQNGFDNYWLEESWQFGVTLRYRF